MGLTLIRKSESAPRKRNPKTAVVLAGGAVSGGAFKVGGLKALDDFLVSRKITDFDIYVGLSAGSILASSLAGGITPDEMMEVLEGTSTRLDQLRPVDFYNPNFGEFAARPAKFIYDLCSYLPSIGLDFARGLPGLPEAVGTSARRLLQQPTYTRFEALVMDLLKHVSPKREIPALTNHVPSGFFDNASLERWLRKSLEKLRLPNDFRAFERKRQRRLYISACDLDTAERAIFGCRREQRNHDLASSAGFVGAAGLLQAGASSTASTTWTAASATPRTSTSPSRRGRTSSSVTTPSDPS